MEEAPSEDRPSEINHDDVLNEYMALGDKWKSYGYRTVVTIYHEDEFANTEGFMVVHRGCGPIMAAGFCAAAMDRFKELTMSDADEEGQGWVEG